MQTLFIMHSFEMEIMVYNVHILEIKVYKVLLWADVFWISYIKFHNNNLSVILGIKQGGRWTSKYEGGPWNPKHEDYASIQLLTLSLNFLVYFTKMSSYFLMKTGKRKVRKYLKWSKKYSQRFDLANGKYLPIFQGVFGRIIKIIHLTLDTTVYKVICIMYLYWIVFQ